MNVNKVTATVRYSQDTGKGAWKSLELGCEASITERENWQATQAHLYSDLAQQFKSLWSQTGQAPEHKPEDHLINGATPRAGAGRQVRKQPLTFATNTV
jgi:hypothetical protein